MEATAALLMEAATRQIEDRNECRLRWLLNEWGGSDLIIENIIFVSDHYRKFGFNALADKLLELHAVIRHEKLSDG